MPPRGRWLVLFIVILTVAADSGCRAIRERRSRRQAASTYGEESPRAQRPSSRQSPAVRRVVCLYDQKPWLNVDAGGDLDPEGIHYRVFLDTGGGKGVAMDGTFYIELYRIDRPAPDKVERTLVSDWRYPTSTFQAIKSATLGMGYHVRLRWASKTVAGNEVEITTMFEGPDGNVVRSGTKRLRVPKFSP